MEKTKDYLRKNGLLLIMLISMLLFLGMTIAQGTYNEFTQSILGIGAIAACINNGIGLLRRHQKEVNNNLRVYLMDYIILGLLPVGLYFINELLSQIRDFSQYWGFLCFIIIIHGVFYAKTVDPSDDRQQTNL